jgi:formamidopyrimidine-DNA glycosylase
MDQRVVAGIGNVYRAELLFRHRVDPFAAGRAVDPDTWEAMWSDLVTLMRSGVRTGRIVTTEPIHRTRRSGRVRTDDAHYVYRQAKSGCRLDGTPVATQLLSGRRLYWCPTSQRPADGAADDTR